MKWWSAGIERLRLMWQEWTGEEDTPFDGDAPAWVVSVAAHLLAILVLGFYFITPPRTGIDLVVATEPLPEVEQIETPEEVYFDAEPSEEVGANSNNSLEMALAQAEVVAPESVVSTEVVEVTNPTVNVEMSLDIATSPVKGDRMVRGSAVGVGTTGASGAVDRLTYEILESLEQRPTLVVWLFDQTLSLKPQRGEIAGRFHKIYEELGVLGKTKSDEKIPLDDKPLLSAAVCYGSGVQELQGPTDDVEALKKAVEGIQNDPSGEERTFQAVFASCQKYLEFRTDRRRNVMVVVVTDEVGTDSATPLVDQSINFARRYQMPVYVVGVPAPFGRREVPFRFVNDDPAFEQTEYMIPVDQGPESRVPEVVPLAFWGQNAEEYELIDSGFGAYQLTRLCYETGGLYFAVHPNRNRAARARGGRMETPANSTVLYHFWDPAVMLPYTPQYMTDAEYQKFVMSNKARAALVSTAQAAATGAMDNPATKFPKFDEGTLATALGEAQKQAAKLGPKLDVLYESIKQGLPDRPKLEEPRWQAGFDLAMGRVMAAVVRTKGYNLMLAEAKSGKPFKDPKNNTWELAHSDAVTTSSSLAKMGEDAKVMLKRVVDEHPGTPWAFLATKELETPMGWEWKETYTEPPAPDNPGNGNGNANPNPNTMLKRKPNAPKPKL